MSGNSYYPNVKREDDQFLHTTHVEGPIA